MFTSRHLPLRLRRTPLQARAPSGPDELARIALDQQDNIYLAGNTGSTDMTMVNPVPPVAPQNGSVNLLLVKLSNDGQTIQLRTLLGGSGDELGQDRGVALAVRPTGRVALGGFTTSDDLPLRNPLQSKRAGNQDWLLMIIDTAPQLELTGASDPAVLPACAAEPCSEVRFTWTLTAPYQLDATVAVTLPEGLEVLPGSVSGAELIGTTLRFSGTVQPNIRQQIRYNARPRKDASLLITTASATSSGAPPVERSLALTQPAEQTGTLVMIYASGDNNLNDALVELAIHAERSAATKDVVGVLLLDGPLHDDTYLYKLLPGQRDCFNRLLDPSCDGRYTLGQTYWKWPDSLASSVTLTTFLVAMQQRYPAAHRVLSLVGHGGGWSPSVLDGQPSRHGGQPSGDLGGMLWDDHPGASLSTAELAQALRTSQQIVHDPLDLVFLDACLMGQLEVAYELRDSAHYLLVSPNWKWAAFPYDQHLVDAAAGDGRVIGLAWIANELETLKPYKDEPYTYSLLDLSQTETLSTAVDALATQLMT